MPQPRIFHLLQRAHGALFRAADQALRDKVGLTAAQQAVLFSLSRSDGQGITAIAAELQMGNSSLTGLVDRLCAKGLAERRQSEIDRRSYSVHLLPAGRDAVAATLADTKRMNAAILAPFTKQEQKTIERFLKHVAESADVIVGDSTKVQTKERRRA